MQYFKFPKQPNYKLIAALLFLFTFLLFGNTIMNDYNMDDELVTKNHRLTSRGISAIPDIFFSSYYADDMGYAYEYRPVVLTSFAIEHSIFGEDPQISHFFNVLLYALLSVLLFFLIVKLLPDIHYGFAFVVTLLFIAHPLHTEVVASIKNRDEILALMGGLGAWYFALKYVQEQKWYLLIFVALLFTAGTFSKLSVLPLAFLIPLSLVLFTAVKKLNLLLLSIIFAVIVVLVAPLFEFRLQLFTLLGLVIAPQFFYLLNSQTFQDIPRLLSNITYTNILSCLRLNMPMYLLCSIITLIITLSILGLIFQYLPLLHLSFFIALITNLISNTQGRKFLTIPLSIAIGLITYVGYLHFVLDVMALYFVLMAVYYEKENKYFHTIAFLLLIPLFIYDNTLFPILFFLTMYIVVQYKEKLKYFNNVLSGIIFFIFLVTIITLIGEGFNLLYLIENLLFISILLGIVYYKMKKIGPKVVLSVFLLIYLFNFPVIESITKFSNIESELEVRTSPTITFSTDRQVEFIETPVTVNDPTDVRIATSADILLRYLKLVVFPHPMSFYYGYAEIEPKQLSDLNVILSFFLHLFLLITALFLLKKYTIPAFGILFYLASIAVYSNYFYPIPGGMGDRLAFTATLGFCILVAYILFKLFKADFSSKYRVDLPKQLVYVLAVILLAYSYKTITRNALWENELTLFSNDIQHVDKSAQAHNLLALNLMQSSLNLPPAERNRTQRRAIDHFDRALEIYPEFFNVYYDKGRSYMLLEEWDKALQSFQYVMENDPHFTRPFYEAASIHLYRGDTNKAIALYEEVIENNPKNITTYNNLGGVYYDMQNYEKSAEISRLSIERIPNAYEGYLNLGKSYYMMGRYQDAIRVLHQAHELKPDDHEVLEGLGASYQMVGDNQRAQYFLNEARRNAPIQ